MPDLRQETSISQPRRPADDSPSAWITAAIAVAIMVGVTMFGGPLQGSYDASVAHHMTVSNTTILNTPDLVGHPPH